MPLDHDALAHWWYEELDYERSLDLARRVLPAFDRDFHAQRDRLVATLGAEILWDTGNTTEALDVAGEYRIRTVAVARQLPSDQRLALVIEALVLNARAALRAGQYRRSLSFAIAAQRQLRLAVGGRERLCAEAARPGGSEHGELYVSILAIAIPAARLAASSSFPAIARMRDALIEDALLILAGAPPSYPRIHGMVAQTFFAVVERGRPEDAQLVESLRALDAATRPGHARAKATVHLVDMSAARFEGNQQLAAAHAAAAARSLYEARLHRHIQALTERGWWTPPPDGC